MSLVGNQRRCGACHNFGHARHNIRCPSQPWNIGYVVTPNTFRSVITTRRYRWQINNGIRPTLTRSERRRQNRNIANQQETTNTNTNTTNTIMQVINTLQDIIPNTIPEDISNDTEPITQNSTYFWREMSPDRISNPPALSHRNWVSNYETMSAGNIPLGAPIVPNSPSSHRPSDAGQDSLEDPIIVTRQNDKTEAVTRIMTMVEENMDGMSDQAYINIMDHLAREYNN